MTSQDYNLLISLLKIQDQNTCLRLVSHIIGELYDDEAGEYNVEYNPHYTYAPGNIPVMLVAHCDTVCTAPVAKIGVCNTIDNKTALTNMDKSPLGADDRAGIYIILKIIAAGYRPHILLTTDEECGGLGAIHAAENIFSPDVKFILELDRQGSNDAAMYDCDNVDFMAMLEQYGFKPVSGTFSDICFFAPEWDIAAANLSVGYYHEHTPWEMLVVSEMENTFNMIKQILDNVENFPYYNFEPVDSTYYTQYSTGEWDYPGALEDINFRAAMVEQYYKKKKKKGKKPNKEITYY